MRVNAIWFWTRGFCACKPKLRVNRVRTKGKWLYRENLVSMNRKSSPPTGCRHSNERVKITIKLKTSVKFWSIATDGVSFRFVQLLLEVCLKPSTDPCKNNALCTVNTTTGNYTCTCKPAFTGRNCTSRVNFCVSSNCKNGATCANGMTSYVCRCAPGYTGKDCQTGKWER